MTDRPPASGEPPTSLPEVRERLEGHIRDWLTEVGATMTECDHRGIGRPGCSTCDPSARPPASGEPRTEAGRELLIRVKAFVYDSRVQDKAASVKDYTNAIARIEAEARATPPSLDVPTLTKAINGAFNLVLGPYTEQDVERVAIEYARLSVTSKEER